MGVREKNWGAIGFSLPAGLEPTPASLVKMQEAMLSEFRPHGTDLNFERPVELTWNRILPPLRNPPWDEIVESAILEIYRRRAFFSVYVNALSPEGSEITKEALINATVLAGHTLIERVRDLAARIADEFYFGSPLSATNRVLQWGRATEKLQRLVDAPALSYGSLNEQEVQSVKSGSRQLIADHFRPVGEETGGVPTLDDAEALRHVVAHGKDRIPEFATMQTVISYAHLMSYYFGWGMWIPFGRSAGAATPEWSDAWKRARIERH